MKRERKGDGKTLETFQTKFLTRGHWWATGGAMVYQLEMQCTPAKVGLPFSYVSFQSIWSSLPKESILIWRKRIPIISLLLWGKYNS